MIISLLKINKCADLTATGRKGFKMKTYRVSYYLDNFYHTYLIEAENECSAIETAIRTIPDTIKLILHDFKIERYIQAW